MRPSQPNQSLIDGLACLQLLAAQTEPIGSREMARILGLEPTRVNRLLKTLAYVGLAQQNRQRKYSSGPGIHVLAAQSLFGSGLMRRSVGPLDELRSSGHIVAMGVLWRDQTCYLYHANPAAMATTGIAQQRPYPAAVSGIGRALLAEQSDQEVRALYAGVDPLAEATGLGSLDGVGGLLEELATTRERGYSISLTTEGNRTIGLVLRHPNTAAVGLSGLFPDSEVPQLVERLRQTAQQIDEADGR